VALPGNANVMMVIQMERKCVGCGKVLKLPTPSMPKQGSFETMEHGIKHVEAGGSSDRSAGGALAREHNSEKKSRTYECRACKKARRKTKQASPFAMVK